jgi:hypothetical protein
VPDATKAIYDALNSVHERVQQHGPEAAVSNWREPGIGSNHVTAR